MNNITKVCVFLKHLNGKSIDPYSKWNEFVFQILNPSPGFTLSVLEFEKQEVKALLIKPQ